MSARPVNDNDLLLLGQRMGFPGKWCDGDDIPWTDESTMPSQLQHINSTASAAFAVTGPLAEARACMLCIQGIPAKSTTDSEASNQTANAEEVKEEETNILLEGRTKMRHIQEADNPVDHLRSNAAY